MGTHPSDESLLTALAHPTRRQLLRHFGSTRGESSPLDCARRLGKPLSNVSYHVRILVECGALTLKTTKPVRGSLQHFYELTPAIKRTAWVQDNLRRLAKSDGA